MAESVISKILAKKQPKLIESVESDELCNAISENIQRSIYDTVKEVIESKDKDSATVVINFDQFFGETAKNMQEKQEDADDLGFKFKDWAVKVRCESFIESKGNKNVFN